MPRGACCVVVVNNIRILAAPPTPPLQWLYLEGIFLGSEDIRNQLPDEAKRFSAVDLEWRSIMTATAKNPNVSARTISMAAAPRTPLSPGAPPPHWLAPLCSIDGWGAGA